MLPCGLLSTVPKYCQAVECVECVVGPGLLAEGVTFSDAVVECTGISAWMEYCQVCKQAEDTARHC